jgi:hypothetical protein
MTTWNYRVVHRRHLGRNPTLDEDVFAIHEVYYDEAGKVTAVSMEPSPVFANSMTGLSWVIDKLREAYEKDVLEWDAIPDKDTKPLDDNDDGDDREETNSLEEK